MVQKIFSDAFQKVITGFFSYVSRTPVYIWMELKIDTNFKESAWIKVNLMGNDKLLFGCILEVHRPMKKM
jgi:hypothetical protein